MRWLADWILGWLRRIPRFDRGLFVIACFALMVPLGWLAHLPSPQPGMPGLAIEFPGTANTALAILRAFSDAGVLGQVKTALIADFFFIIVYVTALASLLEWLQQGENRSTDELMLHALQGVIWAGIFDIVENIGMIVLVTQVDEPNEKILGIAALVTTLAALVKWTLVLAVVGYALWELGKRIARGAGKPDPTEKKPEGPKPEPETTVTVTPPKDHEIVFVTTAGASAGNARPAPKYSRNMDWPSGTFDTSGEAAGTDLHETSQHAGSSKT